MNLKDLGKVFGTAFVSQVVTFLNAVYEPFTGTIFVFQDWQPIASKSAVAVGFLVVLVMTALYSRWKKPVSVRAIVTAAVTCFLLLAACGGIYVLLRTGYAPSRAFLFFIRDVIWMLLYMGMLVMAGVTVALVLLSLFGETPPPPEPLRTDPKAKGKGHIKVTGKTNAKAA